MTTVRYFIPEDGDTESYPNVFLAPKARNQGLPPTLSQIKEAFPLPGRYHFRFKSPLAPGSDREKDAMAVWMDCVQDHVPVPTWRSSIVAKVTRISMDDEDDDEEDDVDGNDGFRQPHQSDNGGIPPHPAPQQQSTTAATATTRSSPLQPAPAVPPAAEAMFDVFDGPVPTPSTTTNLFDAPGPTASTSSLLDMDAPYLSMQRGGSAGSSGNHSAASPSTDFFGMNPTTPSPPSGGFPGVTPPSAYQQAPPSSSTTQLRGAAPNMNNNNNAFDGFSQSQGPFGGLGTPWK